jgi:hypothetical protein
VEHKCDLQKCSTWNILYLLECTYKTAKVASSLGVRRNSRSGNLPGRVAGPVILDGWKHDSSHFGILFWLPAGNGHDPGDRDWAGISSNVPRSDRNQFQEDPSGVRGSDPSHSKGWAASIVPPQEWLAPLMTLSTALCGLPRSFLESGMGVHSVQPRISRCHLTSRLKSRDNDSEAAH